MGIELERTYAAPDDVSLADVAAALSGLDDVGVTEPGPTYELRATYFDTDRYDLAAHRVTLRRRRGGHDDGWTLKLPGGGDARLEVTAPLGAGRRPPVRLVRLVRAMRGENALVPAVDIATTRATLLLRDRAEADPSVEITDDRVRTQVLADGATLVWRELEVESLRGDADQLDAIEARLTALGIRRSPSPSKLGHALGDRVPALPSAAATSPPGDQTPVADVAMAYVRAQVGQLDRQDPLVRLDRPDSIHKMRVACRRMRSAFATYRDVLDPSVTEPLRGELKWLGVELGHARDAEVTREHLLDAVDELDPRLVVGPIRRDLRVMLDRRYRAAHTYALAALDGDRYLALRADLESLCADPPVTGRGLAPAEDALRETLRRARRRVRRAGERAAALPQGSRRDAAVHEVRKAAKRARYAAESATPVLGRRAATAVDRWTEVQDVLGEAQDAVVTVVLLRELADDAGGRGRPTFTYGALAAQAIARGSRAADLESLDLR